jgi:hypothetical protein
MQDAIRDILFLWVFPAMTDTDKFSPYKLVNRVADDRILLPGIQREFEWSEADIKKLFDSILSNYPVGSLLVWRRRKNIHEEELVYSIGMNYSPRRVSKEAISTTGLTRFEDIDDSYLENGTEAKIIQHRTHELSSKRKNDLNSSDYVDFAVDGQQRLTALNIGLRGSYSKYDSGRWKLERRLYINLHKMWESGQKSKVGSKSETGGLNFDFRFIDSSDDFIITDSSKTPRVWVRLGLFYEIYTEMEHDRDATASADELKGEVSKRLTMEVEDDDAVDHNVANKVIARVSNRLFGENSGIVFEIMDLAADDVLKAFLRINRNGVQLDDNDMFLSVLTNEWSREGVNAKEQINSFVDHLSQTETGTYALGAEEVLKCIAICIDDDEVTTEIDIDAIAENLDEVTEQWSPASEDAGGPRQSAVNRTISLWGGTFKLPGNRLSVKTTLYPIVYFFKSNPELEVEDISEGVLKKLEFFVYMSMIHPEYGRRFSAFEKYVTKAIATAESGDFPIVQMDKLLSDNDQDFTLRLSEEHITAGLQKENLLKHSASLGLFRLMYYPRAYENDEADHLHPKTNYTKQNISKDDSLESWEVSQIYDLRDSIVNREYLPKTDYDDREQAHANKETAALTTWLEDKGEHYLRRHYLPENSELWKYKNVGEFFDVRRSLIISGLMERYTKPETALQQ